MTPSLFKHIKEPFTTWRLRKPIEDVKKISAKKVVYCFVESSYIGFGVDRLCNKEQFKVVTCKIPGFMHFKEKLVIRLKLQSLKIVHVSQIKYLLTVLHK